MISPVLDRLASEDPIEAFKWLPTQFKGKLKLSTAFGKEGQVLIHMIATHSFPIEIFTIDTGRLFPETYELMDKTRMRYGVKINTYYPNTHQLQTLVTQKGSHSFYESVENRKECCFIRKVEPLTRALLDADVWITGLRASQSEHRQRQKMVEWNEQHQAIKYNPLIDWSKEQVDDYLKTHKVPYNKLHDQGFASIGCLPCTRAVEAGEDERAGRWWWEKGDKECGLHVRVPA